MSYEDQIMAWIMGSLEMAYELWPPQTRPNVPEVKAAFAHLMKLMKRGKLRGVLVRSMANHPAAALRLSAQIAEAVKKQEQHQEQHQEQQQNPKE